MPVYKPFHDGPVPGIPDNQRVLSGTDPELLLSTGVFMLETLLVSSGVAITDGKDKSLGTGITSFSNDYSPVRLDYGIKITGTVIMAKGYFVEGVLPA